MRDGRETEGQLVDPKTRQRHLKRDVLNQKVAPRSMKEPQPDNEENSPKDKTKQSRKLLLLYTKTASWS